MDTPRGIPTSRAYWDLQAEKLMNRIFDPVDTIDLSTDANRSDLDALALIFLFYFFTFFVDIFFCRQKFKKKTRVSLLF